MPQNGIAATAADRAPFGNAVAFFEKLRARPCFAKFVERDLAIWGSGFSPSFLRANAPRYGLVWFGASLPWALFVLFGKLRAGGKAWGFTRVTQRSLATQKSGASSGLAAALREVDAAPLKAMPGAFPELVSDDCGLLVYDASDALSATTIAALDYLGYAFAPKRVDASLLEHATTEHRKLTPFGELPALVLKGKDGARCLYGARVIVEHVDALTRGDHWCATFDASGRMTPGDAVAPSPQLAPLRLHLLFAPTLRHVFKGDGAALLDAVAAKDCLDPAGARDAAAELAEAFAHPHAPGDMAPYASELWGRVGLVEETLAEAPFLAGASPSLADAFALPVVVLAALYHRRCCGASDPAFSPHAVRPHDARFVDDGRAAHLRGVAGFDRAVSDLGVAHDVPTLDAPLFDGKGMAYSLLRLPDGRMVPHPPCVKPSAVAELRRSFLSRAGDVFVCTYPKCGTTWMQQIVLLLLHGGDATKVKPHPPRSSRRRPGPRSATCARSASAGPAPTSTRAACGRPTTRPTRTGRTRGASSRRTRRGASSPVADANLDPKAKIVYIARNPKDVCCSLYAHASALPPFEYAGDFDHCVGNFVEGKVEHGSWKDHHVDWYVHAQRDERVYYVHFEALKADPRAEIAKLAAFLLDLPGPGDVPPALLDAVAAGSDFKAMKAAAAKAGDGSAEATSRFRSGGAGKWHVSRGGKMTDAHSKAIDDTLLAGLPPGLAFQCSARDARPLPFP
ncbi:sulfotransferase [Aureococcus anophagefferens]|nr:sulfotransferase [Aureococcus anophagefferens]